jgi:hypothetical protein
MNGLITFLSIVMIAFGVLQIILFFKIWGMTSDVAKMASDVAKIAGNLRDVVLNSHSSSTMHTPASSDAVSTEDSKPTYANKSKGITYAVYGSVVTFSDGIKGEIKQYSTQCSFITEDNFELLYQDLDCACIALYAYLTTHKELQAGLVLKDRNV